MKSENQKNPEAAEAYRKVNREIRKGTKAARATWIEDRCYEAFHLLKTITNEVHQKSSAIEDSKGRLVSHYILVLDGWTEYCSEQPALQLPTDDGAQHPPGKPGKNESPDDLQVL